MKNNARFISLWLDTDYAGQKSQIQIQLLAPDLSLSLCTQYASLSVPNLFFFFFYFLFFFCSSIYGFFFINLCFYYIQNDDKSDTLELRIHIQMCRLLALSLLLIRPDNNCLLRQNLNSS